MAKPFVLPPAGPNRRLDSWKEIAAFFGRDERTVKRWEKERGLPVHRLPGASKAGVFAFTGELSNWLHPADEPAPAAPAPEVPQVRVSRVRWATIAALASVALAAAAIALNFPLGTRRAAAHITNPEAEDLYLKGRYYWNKRTPDDLNKAVDLFTQAIVHDPGYAKAYAGLADSYNLLREFSLMPSNEAFKRSLAAARRAVELDSSLADAHNSLAFASFYGAWDFQGAQREFERAIQLDSHYATAYHWYANALACLRRFDDAMARIDRARELDPNSNSILADRALIRYVAGKPAEAIELLKEVTAADPSFQSPHAYLALIYLNGGSYREYLAEDRLLAQLAHDAAGLSVVDAGANGFASGGGAGLLNATFDAQKKLYQQDQESAYVVARTAAHLGCKAEALAYLRTALDKHDMLMVGLLADPSFTGLRGDPDFRKIVAQVGLPDK